MQFLEKKWSVIRILLAFEFYLSAGEEFCLWDRFEPRCARAQVIQVESARYGRIADSKCITNNYGYTGCTQDVLGIAERRCAGRQECSIAVPDEQMSKSTEQICPSDLVKFLSVTYSCLQVKSPAGYSCDIAPSAHSSAQHGHLASVFADGEHCGTSKQPWIFKLNPGQRLNLTLHDYQAHAPYSVGDRKQKATDRVYVIINEGGETTTIFGGQKRRSHVYTSRGGQVEVRMLPGSGNQKRYFLLEYFIDGCPHLQTPEGGWIEMTGSRVTLGCLPKSDKQPTWMLECLDNRWHGDAHEHSCESEAVVGQIVQETGFHMPLVVSVVVIVSVALLLGCLILTTGVCLIKRRRRKERAELPRQYPAALEPAYKEAALIPDYLGNPPPYYASHTSHTSSHSALTSQRPVSPEHDYEYVADLIGQTPVFSSSQPDSNNKPELPRDRPRPHTGISYGTLETPTGGQTGSHSNTPLVTPSGHSTTTMVTSSGQSSANEYVSEGEKPATRLPKYFELNPKLPQVALGLRQHADNIKSYPPPDSSRRNFGHYSQ